MSLINLCFGGFGTAMFIMDKYVKMAIAAKMLPWAQISNAGAALVNAFFLYKTYNIEDTNPFSDPRYAKIFVMNEVADLSGLVWGGYTAYKQNFYCDICDPASACYDETAQCLAV